MTVLRSTLSLLLAAVLTTGASPAFADSPSTWDSGPSRSAVENIVFFGGSVAGLFLLVTLFALLTARNNFVPEPPEPAKDVEAHSGH
ncbi:MAG TPA: hypothetical protein VK948_08860 [Aeromicrobium sp.]|nr:hypothetical protein [Aeromicrobium sp.]